MTFNSDVYFVETGHVVFVGFLEEWMDILPDHFFRIHFAPQSFGLRWKQNQKDEESQHLGPGEVEFVGLDHFHDWYNDENWLALDRNYKTQPVIEKSTQIHKSWLLTVSDLMKLRCASFYASRKLLRRDKSFYILHFCQKRVTGDDFDCQKIKSIDLISVAAIKFY